jgi:hypothetical protein
LPEDGSWCKQWNVCIAVPQKDIGIGVDIVELRLSVHNTQKPKN